MWIIYGAKMENINLWRERLRLTTGKFDTTAQDSSTNPTSGAKRSFLKFFSATSPTFAGGGGSGARSPTSVAVIGGGLKSGEFMAVDEHRVAAYMEPIEERI